MTNPVLQIHNLSKHYGSICAVNNLSFTVEKGTVFGLLGPNGSGKTTTLGILLGVINSTGGSFSWFNNGDISENRKRIGAILENPNFYPYLSAVRNLEVTAEIKGAGNNRIKEVLKLVDLYDRRNSAFKTFSLGMKQRLSIAAALLSDPEVLVLDEPTNGLDPQGIAEVRDLIMEVAGQGKTILLASHLLDEVEKVCTHVAVLKAGNLLTSGSVNEILKGEATIEVSSEDLEILYETVKAHFKHTSVKVNNGKVIFTTNEHITGSEINNLLFSNGIIASHLTIKKKSLEAQFLEITSK